MTTFLYDNTLTEWRYSHSLKQWGVDDSVYRDPARNVCMGQGLMTETEVKMIATGMHNLTVVGSGRVVGKIIGVELPSGTTKGYWVVLNRHDDKLRPEIFIVQGKPEMRPLPLEQ